MVWLPSDLQDATTVLSSFDHCFCHNICILSSYKLLQHLGSLNPLCLGFCLCGKTQGFKTIVHKQMGEFCIKPTYQADRKALPDHGSTVEEKV